MKKNFELAEEDQPLWEQISKEFKRLNALNKEDNASSTLLTTVDIYKIKENIATRSSSPYIIKAPKLSADNFEKRILQDLKKGHKKIERYIDLHNYTITQGEAKFKSFILDCFQHKYRVILIITGKGIGAKAILKSSKTKQESTFQEVLSPKSTLRKEFFSWVQQEDIKPYIISYSQALPKDGGEGAFYVHLRANR
ncbi:Smr/MutS family protein [Candidatus Hepatincolaceae symbiont of Richtersius coronifer]